MPIHVVHHDGKWFIKWGEHGHEYEYTKGDMDSLARARRKAEEQAKAAYAHGYRGSGHERGHQSDGNFSMTR